MADLNELFEQYRRSYEADEQADPREWLHRVEGEERDELRRRIEAYLEGAPAPAWDRAAFASSRAAAVLGNLDESLVGASGLWPTILPRLRDQAKIPRSDLITRLAEELGHPEQREKVEDYYHQMERGLLPSRGVRDRVLEALGRLTGASVAYLRKAGEAVTPAPPASPGTAVFARVAGPPAAEYEVADAAPAKELPGEESRQPDEIDDLFTGGG